MSDHLIRYLTALETLEPTSLDALMQMCHADIRFRDPFNDTRGTRAYRRVLEDMFEKLEDIEFRVVDAGFTSADQRRALARWELRATLTSLGRQPWKVEGCSAIEFDKDDRVTAHYDFWDAGAGLYEKLPLIGRLVAYLRRRLRVDQ